MRETISLDFDGVLHDYRAGWTGYVPEGEPVPGARAAVLALLAMDYEVVISSCRAYTQIGREGIREWLGKHGFPVERLHVTCEKPHAAHYVDDRAIRFEGEWPAVFDQLRRPVWFEAKKEPGFDSAG